jgi:hypothetical protein
MNEFLSDPEPYLRRLVEEQRRKKKSPKPRKRKRNQQARMPIQLGFRPATPPTPGKIRLRGQQRNDGGVGVGAGGQRPLQGQQGVVHHPNLLVPGQQVD